MIIRPQLPARPWVERVAKLSIPFAVDLAMILAVHATHGVGYVLFPLLVAYVFPPWGKESIVPIAIGMGIPPEIVSVSIITVDITKSLFILWNFDYLYAVPYVGIVLKRIEGRANKALAKKGWLRSSSLLSLTLFMVIPFQGTGATTTSVIGRILNLPKEKVLVAVIVGSLASTLSIAYTSKAVISLIVG